MEHPGEGLVPGQPHPSSQYLLGINYAEFLLHLAPLVVPAVLVGDEGQVGVLGGAVLACAALYAAPLLLLA